MPKPKVVTNLVSRNSSSGVASTGEAGKVVTGVQSDSVSTNERQAIGSVGSSRLKSWHATNKVQIDNQRIRVADSDVITLIDNGIEIRLRSSSSSNTYIEERVVESSFSQELNINASLKIDFIDPSHDVKLLLGVTKEGGRVAAVIIRSNDWLNVDRS